jgi:hypothetical protein
MIIIDWLFKICYSPFRNAIKGGKIAGVFLFTPILNFIILGLLNSILYLIFNVNLTDLGALSVALLTSGNLFLVAYFLNRAYIKGDRDPGRIRLPVINGILIPLIILASVFFYTYTLLNFH